ncbi:hypothetical protein C1S81_15400 [Mycolicibacterium neoaurum]|nr:hypothetical protein DXK33_03840 [Mycolicibacterium neoaurum]TLH57884.1 hypothetical protein C1S81_15400 [Mycolicibacterium neoaurum]
MASELLCCPGGTESLHENRTGPGPGTARARRNAFAGLAEVLGAPRDRFADPDLRARHLRAVVRSLGNYTVRRT